MDVCADSVYEMRSLPLGLNNSRHGGSDHDICNDGDSRDDEIAQVMEPALTAIFSLGGGLETTHYK